MADQKAKRDPWQHDFEERGKRIQKNRERKGNRDSRAQKSDKEEFNVQNLSDGVDLLTPKDS